MAPSIHLQRIDNVALVTMDRQGRKNAFDEAMFTALEAVTHDLAQQLPRVVVITGTDRDAFSAGFDVNPQNPLVADFLKVLESHAVAPAQRMIARIRRAVDGFVALPVPIIAAINGSAYGGGMELATRCDLRVMDAEAEICFSEVRLGLMPDWGGGPSLTRLVGPAVAADLILTARPVDADEALHLGLVNRISGPGKALQTALDLARQIARNGPRAVRAALAVIRQSGHGSLSEALALEAHMAAELIAGGECLHGITAFMEKRPPEFPDG